VGLCVYTTLDDKKAAQALARSAVAKKLAACVHIEQIQSVFSWEDALQEAPEFRLLFKTTDATYDALAAHILAEHPYDEPALWAVPMTRGSNSFLDWIASETRS